MTLQMIYQQDKTSRARQKLASTQDPPVVLLILQVETGLDVIRADQGRGPFTRTLQGRGGEGKGWELVVAPCIFLVSRQVDWCHTAFGDVAAAPDKHVGCLLLQFSLHRRYSLSCSENSGGSVKQQREGAGT